MTERKRQKKSFTDLTKLSHIYLKECYEIVFSLLTHFKKDDPFV